MHMYIYMYTIMYIHTHIHVHVDVGAMHSQVVESDGDVLRDEHLGKALGLLLLQHGADLLLGGVRMRAHVSVRALDH